MPVGYPSTRAAATAHHRGAGLAGTSLAIIAFMAVALLIIVLLTRAV